MHNKRFRAFFSYSHQARRQVADRIHRDLERLGRSRFQLRKIRIFRDKTDLSANPGLWGTIQASLDDSEYLLYAATPEAAQSPWVQRELLHWIRTHGGRAEKLLILLLDGRIEWESRSPQSGAVLAPALPDVLKDEAGTLKLKSAFAEEPLWVDFRWLRSAGDASLHNPAYLDAISTLAATLQGVPKAELIYDDAIEQRRAARSWKVLTVIGALTLFAVGLGALEIMRARELQARDLEQSNRAEKRLSERRANAIHSELLFNLSLANRHAGLVLNFAGRELWPRRALSDHLQTLRESGIEEDFERYQYAALLVNPETVPDEVWDRVQDHYAQLRDAQAKVRQTLDTLGSLGRTPLDEQLHGQAVQAALGSLEASYCWVWRTGSDLAAALEQVDGAIAVERQFEVFMEDNSSYLASLCSEGLSDRVSESLSRLSMGAQVLLPQLENLDEADIQGHIYLALLATSMEETDIARTVFEGLRAIGERDPQHFEMVPYAMGGLFKLDHPEFFSEARGVIVTDVVDGYAGEAAGLREGDFILSYAGEPLDLVDELIEAVTTNSAPNPALLILRDQRPLALTVPRGPLGLSVKDYGSAGLEPATDR